VHHDNPSAKEEKTMRPVRLVGCALLALLAVAAPTAAAPEGQMTWGVHISLAPQWFDPAETQGIITPFMVMYAIHDAMAKAMPGNVTAPSPGGVVASLVRRTHLRHHPPQRREVPQW